MLDAYAAGLFDGEGFVRVDVWKKPNSTHTRYQVIVGLGVTYRPVVEQLRVRYGGTLSQNRHDLRNPKYRIQYCWGNSSQGAASFLRRVLPFLVIKREQTELALELQSDIDKYRYKLGNQYQSHPDRDLIFENRAALASRIKALKKETFPSLNG